MDTGKCEEQLRELRSFYMRHGFSEDAFMTSENMDVFVETSVDAYRNYPMFLYVFNGKYDEETLARMFRVDYTSRLKKMLGIKTEGGESLILIGPPTPKRTGLKEYIKAADMHSLLLLLNPSTYRQEAFEKYAMKMRKPYLDDKTWYIYIFGTRKALQRQGYGKKLMKVLIAFADENGYNLCLETNASENVPMYERFGFRLMDTSVFKRRIWHYVMVYDGKGVNPG